MLIRSPRRHPWFALAVVILAAGSCLPTSARAADTYKIDPVHSMVVFKIGHLNLGNVLGRFNDPMGTIVVDPADPSKLQLEAELKVENVDTHNAQRDAHLKSDAFFDAAKFPLITFKSTSVKPTGKDTFDMTGDLTLHGVTKSITVQLTHIGEGKDPFGGVRSGYETTLNIKRSDFGMSGMLNLVGDAVTLTINVEGVKQ